MISETVQRLWSVDGCFSFLQLLQHVKSVNFTNQFKEKVYFDEKGEPVPLYDIINWQKDSKSNIRYSIMFVFQNNL